MVLYIKTLFICVQKDFFGKSGLHYTLLSRIFLVHICTSVKRLLKVFRRFLYTPLPLFFRDLTWISHVSLVLEYRQPCNSGDDFREKGCNDHFY